MLVKSALRLPYVMALVRAMSMPAAEKLVISPSMMATAPSNAAAIYNIRWQSEVIFLRYGTATCAICLRIIVMISFEDI
jgi:hypothetical protein